MRFEAIKDDETLEEFAERLEKDDLREAWCASEVNMKRTFSSSTYKEVTFEEWFTKQFKKK